MGVSLLHTVRLPSGSSERSCDPGVKPGLSQGSLAMLPPFPSLEHVDDERSEVPGSKRGLLGYMRQRLYPEPGHCDRQVC